MKLLLDTHIFLWYYSGDNQLSQLAKDTISSPENIFYVSIASFWEITIKMSLKKLELNATQEDFLNDVIDKKFLILNIGFSHLNKTASLPFYHRDPFDRLIIGQAIAEQMTLISKDSFFTPYCHSGLSLIF